MIPMKTTYKKKNGVRNYMSCEKMRTKNVRSIS